VKEIFGAILTTATYELEFKSSEDAVPVETPNLTTINTVRNTSKMIWCR